MALIFSSFIARPLNENVIFKIYPNTFVHKVNTTFWKVFPIFFFFFLGKIIKCFISTLTSSFIGLFLASLCLIRLIFRALQKCLRDLLHISFFLVSGGVTFLWSIGVSVAMSKRKRAPPFACANILELYVTYGNTLAHLFIYMFIYIW